ncbi:MAG TPA: sugar ABC transporter permease [Eubacteriales bacterium]|nr:sugar ABC transporter permease [Clostridia bacterium]HRR89975.1 sugar ABC transporter permease [Eubacteriales bacterium]HRU84745.1 sugar ABC transporter permease [Eubacteriales bacterium]
MKLILMKKEKSVKKPEKVVDRSSISYRAKIFIKKNLAGWLIMLPGVALFSFFVWAPLVQNISLSFYRTVGFERAEFVGFANYVRVFGDPIFIQAFKNTFKYVLYSLAIGFIIPIFLGLLLSEVVHFKSLFRIGLYFPSIISGIAVVIMWSYLFNPNPGAVLNAAARIFRLGPFKFLDNPKASIPLIVLTMTWRGMGATALIYLSALQNVDTAQYEAARIDGANAWQRMRHITLPHLRPTVRMLFILQIISVFQVFYEPLVMTKGGGPNGASVSLLLLSYQYAFQKFDASASAAVGVILSFIIIALTVVYLRLSARRDKDLIRPFRPRRAKR